jgi:hypothetical protein
MVQLCGEDMRPGACIRGREEGVWETQAKVGLDGSTLAAVFRALQDIKPDSTIAI